MKERKKNSEREKNLDRRGRRERIEP